MSADVKVDILVGKLLASGVRFSAMRRDGAVQVSCPPRGVTLSCELLGFSVSISSQGSQLSNRDLCIASLRRHVEHLIETGDKLLNSIQ